MSANPADDNLTLLGGPDAVDEGLRRSVVTVLETPSRLQRVLGCAVWRGVPRPSGDL
jgi:hypothetical protein